MYKVLPGPALRLYNTYSTPILWSFSKAQKKEKKTKQKNTLKYKPQGLVFFFSYS